MELEVKNLEKKFNDFTAVNKINFKVSAGKTLGLLGPNGCGKTTTIGMLLGLIKPTKGNILISNHNLNNLDLKNWRSNLGIVFQDSYLINDTIAANIALGEKNINLRKVKECLIKANAFEFVKNLDKGFDEIIEVLPKIRKEIPNIFYLILGDGDDINRLKNRFNLKLLTIFTIKLVFLRI